jgi:carbamoyl-phosphate synthase large subunit
MYRWLDSADELAPGGRVKILLNDRRLIALCRDKWTFFEAIAASGLQCVIDTTLESDFETLATSSIAIPAQAEKRFGSKGIVKVDSRATFSRAPGEDRPVLMAQPIMVHESEEFSTSAFADGNGGLHAHMTLRRKLSNEGFTDRAEVVDR